MRLCVFCGSSDGDNPGYREAAHHFGATLARRGIGLVYGGGKVGLMGAVADGAISGGGEVVGVMPRALVEKEIAHEGLTKLEVVASMHERKARMAEMGEGFVALPGGLGTFEELFEVWTWAQLGYHKKPCALLDVRGFYDKLIVFLDDVAARGFVRENHRAMLIVEADADRLIDRVKAYHPPSVTKWMKAADR